MRIGIDTTALPAQPVGAGTYIIQLVRAMIALDSDHQWVIYAHQGRQDLFDLPRKDNFEWVLVPDKSPARRMIWEQTVLPVLAHQARIDLLHSLHYTRPLYLPCASVVTFHDMTFFITPKLHTLSKRSFFPIAIRLSARLADALIAVSESTRQDAIRILDIPPNRITTTNLGVSSIFQPITDPNRLAQARRKYSLPESYLLYIGTIEPRKNLPLLINAYNQLIQQNCDRELVIVGRRGWMYEDVYRQIDALNLKERVHFTGYVPTEDLPALYNLAQIFIYPSRYEGFGIPPVEAMACGTPVITTQSSAMIETIGEAGFLIPPDEVSALVNAIQMLNENANLHDELRQKGLQRASRFNWKKTAEDTLAVYEQIVIPP